MSRNRPHPPSQRHSTAAVRSSDPQRDWQLEEAADPSWDAHQLHRMSWRAEGAQDYPGGALDTLLEISQRRGACHLPGDARLREIICKRLTEDPLIDADDIEVEVRDAEVTLRGSVRERSQKRRAEELVAGLTTVADIHNCLVLAQCGTDTSSHST